MPGASVRSRGNLLIVAPLPPVLPPSGVRHQPEIPYSTGVRVARPREFEPLTFGSVAAKMAPEHRNRGQFDRRQLALGVGTLAPRGERAQGPRQVRRLLVVRCRSVS